MRIFNWIVFWGFLVMFLLSVVITVLSIIEGEDKAMIAGSWLSGIFGAATLIYWFTEL